MRSRLLPLWIAAWLLGSAGPGVTDGPTPFEGGLNPELWLVRSTNDHRVVVFRRCSPEHCFTESYLQWLKTEWQGERARRRPVVVEVATVALTEANGVGAFVKEATWRTENNDSVLYLELANSYTDKAVVRLRVEPLGQGKYRAEVR
jgi:hypothetical protein